MPRIFDLDDEATAAFNQLHEEELTPEEWKEIERRLETPSLKVNLRELIDSLEPIGE